MGITKVASAMTVRRSVPSFPFLGQLLQSSLVPLFPMLAIRLPVLVVFSFRSTPIGFDGRTALCLFIVDVLMMDDV
jgi:hypothetical protein